MDGELVRLTGTEWAVLDCLWEASPQTNHPPSSREREVSVKVNASWGRTTQRSSRRSARTGREASQRQSGSEAGGWSGPSG